MGNLSAPGLFISRQLLDRILGNFDQIQGTGISKKRINGIIFDQLWKENKVLDLQKQPIFLLIKIVEMQAFSLCVKQLVSPEAEAFQQLLLDHRIRGKGKDLNFLPGFPINSSDPIAVNAIILFINLNEGQPALVDSWRTKMARGRPGSASLRKVWL